MLRCGFDDDLASVSDSYACLQACIYLVKSVLYGCAAYGFLNMVFALGDAASRWASQGGLGDYMASLGLNISMGPLLAVTMTLAAISALMIEV